MQHELTTHWTGEMAFAADFIQHQLVMDATPDVGGHETGPTPKPLVLAALAGCTGMDVVSLLNKMRAPVEKFWLETTGELTEEHPVQYHTIHLVYHFQGPELDREKIEKAVTKSQEKYCGVSAILQKALNLQWRIEYHNTPA